MDWISNKLSMLIEEGRKALNREIVVMSDAKEDEVDDGSGAWEEEQVVPSNPHPIPKSISHSSSVKRTNTRRPLPLPLVSPNPNTFESLSPSFDHPSAPNPTPSPTYSHSRSLSTSTSTFDQDDNTSTSFHEDERTWESPELRESMERARARAMMNLDLTAGFCRRGT